MRYIREEAPFQERHIIIETEEERVLFNKMIQFVLDKVDLSTSHITEIVEQSDIWDMAYNIKHGGYRHGTA